MVAHISFSMVVGIIAIIVIVAIAAAYSQVPRGESVRIGISVPLTGPVARFGEWSLRGAQLAVDRINDQGGVNGKMIELVVEDDKCMAEHAVTAVNKMQNTQGINKLVVVCTAPAPAVAPITKGNSIVFSPSFKVKALEEGDYPHYFSLQPSMGREVEKLIEYLKSRNYRKVAIIYTLNDFWASYKGVFVELGEKNGLDISVVESSEFLNTDFRTQLTKIKYAEAEILFSGLNPAPFANMLKQMKEIGMDLPVVGIWYTQTPDLIKVAGGLTEGIVYTYHYKDGATSENIIYTSEYRETHGEDPEFASASTYDAIYILKYLIEECGDSIDCMIDKTNRIKDYRGASGIITFSNGTTLKEIYLKTIKNGEFVPYGE